MDILLDSKGDLYVSPKGDIALANSVAQKIRIKLLWFEGEWKWDVEEGMPYREELLKKNPDTDFFEGVIREKIFEVEEITEVKDVKIVYDKRKRTALVTYVAVTDYETIKDEISLQETIEIKENDNEDLPSELIVKDDGRGNVTVTATNNVDIVMYDDFYGNAVMKALGNAELKTADDRNGNVFLSLLNL